MHAPEHLEAQADGRSRALPVLSKKADIETLHGTVLYDFVR